MVKSLLIIGKNLVDFMRFKQHVQYCAEKLPRLRHCILIHRKVSAVTCSHVSTVNTLFTVGMLSCEGGSANIVIIVSAWQKVLHGKRFCATQVTVSRVCQSLKHNTTYEQPSYIGL